MTAVLIIVILIQLATLVLMYEVLKALTEVQNDQVDMKRDLDNFNGRQEADKTVMIEAANVVSRYDTDLKTVKTKVGNLEHKAIEIDKAIEQLKGWSGK